MLTGKTVLITGGTGSFGKVFTRTILNNYDIKKLIIFSRDELKQFEMEQQFKRDPDIRFLHDGEPRVRFFIGNVRDKERLYRAFHGVDYVIHAAALKQVPAAEYNPFEAVKTNIIGAENVINTAIDQGVEKVIALSTDKAANPINLYGATKLCSDKLFIAGNAYSGDENTKFSVVRYGNVVGSRGSVIPFFLKERDKGVLPVTDKDMTRFWITLPHGVDFVIGMLNQMIGGEIFVPKIPSMRILDLAQAIAPDCRIDYIGIRPGEKLHEVLISQDDARNTYDCGDHYTIAPDLDWWQNRKEVIGKLGKQVPAGFIYASDTNDCWCTREELQDILKNMGQ